MFESGVLGILVGHDALVMVGPAGGFGGYLAGICGVKHFPAVRGVVKIQGEGRGKKKRAWKNNKNMASVAVPRDPRGTSGT